MHPEQNTLTAINNLKDEYPYAASMLVFVLIERELKKYLIKHRHEKALQEEKAKINCRYVSVKDFNDKDDITFLNKFISKITLGTTEQILKIDGNPPSALRNDLIHSREYLLSENKLAESERERINHEKFEKSKQDIVRIFDLYSDYSIEIESNGQLSFKPKI